MENKLLGLYTDYLISQNGLAFATCLSENLDGEVSHDKITRFLNFGNNDSKELWDEVKPHSKENEIIAWHYSHAKGIHVKES